MQWHDFVFSEKPAIRLLRHSVFWMAWWIYFTVCQYILEQPYVVGLRPRYILIESHIEIKIFFIGLLVCVGVLYVYLCVVTTTTKG